MEASNNLNPLKQQPKTEPESPKFGEWISVKNQHPDHENLVLCLISKCGKVRGNNEILWYENGRWGNIDVDDYEQKHSVDYLTISHWMPLPEPPKTL